VAQSRRTYSVPVSRSGWVAHRTVCVAHACNDSDWARCSTFSVFCLSNWKIIGVQYCAPPRTLAFRVLHSTLVLTSTRKEQWPLRVPRTLCRARTASMRSCGACVRVVCKRCLYESVHCQGSVVFICKC